MMDDRWPRQNAVTCKTDDCRHKTRNYWGVCDECLRGPSPFSAAGVRPPSHCSTPAAELLGQSSGPPPVPRSDATSGA